MLKFLQRSMIGVALSLPLALSAQTAQPRADDPNPPYTAADRDDDTGKWGLLGLVGLAGLFGMKRADRTDRVVNTRTSVGGTPVTGR